MGQMDPAASKTSSRMTDYSDFSVSPGPIESAPPRTSGTSDIQSPESVNSHSAEKLIEALTVAADKTAAAIALGTKQTSLEVRERLNEVMAWLISNVRPGAPRHAHVPPVIAREYVSTLKTNFLAELDTTTGLNANEVVRTLIKLDEAEEAWRRTDRGKFISRLTGADCADAVVAIAHDIRSPLGSILLLVDSLRRAERTSPNPRSEEHTSELQSQFHLVCRLLLEKKKK